MKQECLMQIKASTFGVFPRKAMREKPG